MQGNLSLLDCTLRDGGFVNDWRFGKSTIRAVINRLDLGGIDIIECGFLDSRVAYDEDRTMFSDIPAITRTIGSAVPKRAKLVAMIDYGTFDKELLIPKSESVIDGIRLIFKKEQVDEALEYARLIKECGYMLFLNPVALTSYRNIEVIRLVEKINDIQPYGVSVVDTYGLMFNSDVDRFIYLMDSELSQEISLGYHCHNNLQMANSHCIKFINMNLTRDTVVDVSILGMGKNAGNACTELIGSYLSKFDLKELDMNQVLDCAYTNILRFFTKTNWGYSLDSLLSAIHDCSPNWIKFLINKKTLSIKDISAILDMLPFEKREVSFYSKELAEQKYIEYLDHFINDDAAIASLGKELSGRDILLLCPGKTLKTHKTDIDRYIEDVSPIVITVNFISNTYRSDYAFVSNSIRYSQMTGLCSEYTQIPSILLTSNIVPNDVLAPVHTFNYKSLYDSIEGDSGAVLFISLMKRMNIEKFAIAGMDGFNKETIDDNFFDNSMSIGLTGDVNTSMVKQLKKVLDSHIRMHMITPSVIERELI